MPTLTLPRLGETMASGRVVGWLKHPGDAFRRGETLVEIESDKTVVELPALADGVLREIFAREGQDIAVGEPLCRFEGSGAEGPDHPHPNPLPEGEGALPLPLGLGREADQGRGGGAASPAKLRATPLARRLAAANGLALPSLRGTGRRGRIEARDVRAASAPSAPALPQASAPILLLHGFGGDAQSWSGFIPHLARAGRVATALDLAGDSLAALVGAVTAWLDGSGGAPVELVGHSLGGAVATLAARSRPHRVARLTLLAPAGLGSEIDADFVHGMAQVRSGGGLAHLLRRLAVRPPPLSAAQLDTMAQALGGGRLTALAEALAAGGRQQIDIVPDLAALAMPVRIVWGLEDRIIPWTQATRAGSRVALHLIQGAGHMAHWDRPEEVAALFA
jgi:pyruvate dehydrogenase E2 component (dihydrolipoamide acetyltransferase)